MLVLLFPLVLPHCLEHSLGLVHLVLLLLYPLTHSGVGILRIESVWKLRRASHEQLMGHIASCRTLLGVHHQQNNGEEFHPVFVALILSPYPYVLLENTKAEKTP